MFFAFGLIVRHFLYDMGWAKSKGFDIPVVVVGNLIVGGAGKSPMTEYLISMLGKQARVAVLSRGYGRRTKGFKWVYSDSSSNEVGDEPLQIKRKFPYIDVAVCEKRVIGVEHLQKANEIVLLDDAFQHRALQGGLNILLFDYQSLFQPKWVLPSGNYRDLFSRRKHADIIVITKCPEILDEKEKDDLRLKLRLPLVMPVLFSYLRYKSLVPIWHGLASFVPDLDHQWTVVLVTGIANPAPLLDYVFSLGVTIKHLPFADHHDFTKRDIGNIKKNFDRIDSDKKIILATEKDAMRLSENDMGVYAPFFYYLPIAIDFDEKDKTEFDDLVGKFCIRENS